MTHLDAIARQRDFLAREVGKFVGKGDAYALVDFPHYSNIGDSAIWVGAVTLLKDLTDRLPSYVCANNRLSIDELNAAMPQGPIFILGGGNFGDVWLPHQRFRERLMAEFPDRTIIQLPQSLHFRTDPAIAQAAAAIAKHQNFHLMVRDEASRQFAEQNFKCPVVLAPDCAPCMGPQSSSADKVHEVFALFRSDAERTDHDYSALQILEPYVCDWIEEPPLPRHRFRLQAMIQAALAGTFSKPAVRAHLFNITAQHRVRRGLDMLSSGRLVITDRLHAHILCVLLGQPHVSMDNSYGKVSGYYKMWMDGIENGYVVQTPDEVLAALGKMKNLAAA